MPTDYQPSDQESKPATNATTKPLGEITPIAVEVYQNENLNSLGDFKPALTVVNKDGQVFTVVLNISDVTGYWSGPIFLPYRPCRIISISINFQGNANNAGTMELDFQRYGQGAAINGSGTTLLTTRFNLKAGALTTQVRVGTGLVGTACVIDRDSNVAIYPTGGAVPTNVNGICINIHYVYLDEKDYNDVL